MQDLHSVGVGGGGRFYDSGDRRRLRQHHHGHHENFQPVKCPRCDSINTKFCYYNNYNLSQPRHFCKSCRRYWTKGGVLRNVPVGGGCRKTKRSKQKISSKTKDNSHSSSESSSLTTPTAATEAVSAPSTGSGSKFFVANANASFEAGSLIENQTPDCGFFSEVGNFKNMSTSTNGQMTFGFGNLPDVGSFPASQFHFHDNPFPVQKLGEEMRIHETDMSSGLHDLTAQIDLLSSSQNRSTNIGFGALDWHQSGDQGLFDLPPTVVDQAYWNQHQWLDRDNHGLFLP